MIQTIKRIPLLFKVPVKHHVLFANLTRIRHEPFAGLKVLSCLAADRARLALGQNKQSEMTQKISIQHSFCE